MSSANPLFALIAYLDANADIAQMTSGRVFGEHLPQIEAASMPRACLVVKSYGGTGFSTIQAVNRDYVIRAYGATMIEADQLQELVAQAMTTLGRQVVTAGSKNTLLHSALLQTGPFYGRDPDTYWDYYYSSWSVQSDYREVN